MGKEYCLTFKVKVANDISPFKREYSTPPIKEFKENSFPKSCNLTKFLLTFLESETINFSIYSINFSLDLNCLNISVLSSEIPLSICLWYVFLN